MQQELPFSPKIIIWTGIIGLLIAILIITTSLFNESTKLVFCDVGQGDGIYLRLNNKTDIIIDSGAKREMMHCLGKYMPFYDRKIEMVFITHPDKDHAGGLIYILDRYKIDKVFSPPINNDAQFFNKVKKKLRDKKITVPTTGDTIKLDQSYIYFIWPTKDYLKSNLNFKNNQLRSIFTPTSKDLNSFSLVFYLYHKNKTILFTGDATPEVLSKLIKKTTEVDILKIPHHGAKNGLTESFLKATSPKETIISVGKNNSYGHPSPEIINMLEKNNYSYRRTDLEGNIVFKLK